MNDLTDAEYDATCFLQDYLRVNGGDSAKEFNSSPNGDGRWVPLIEVFPRTVKGNFQRQAIRRAHAKGIRGFEIAIHDDCAKAVACELVSTIEREAGK